jgi:hypothetical protein
MSASKQIISDPFRDQSQQKSCSSCGVTFTCGLAAGKGSCWCEELPHISLAVGADQDCLCPTCLSEAIANLSLPKDHSRVSASGKVAASSPPILIEGEDYYCEGPAIVFTANYLLRRGYCCESGCRHCPYGEKKLNRVG